MLDANTKNLKVYGLDVPGIVLENLKLDFKKEIASGEKLIIDSDDNITRFFEVLDRIIMMEKNNVTYELLIFTFNVAKKAVDGDNLVKDEKKIPGFTIDYIFRSMCRAIKNIEKNDVKNLNLAKDVCDLIKQVLNNDGLVKKLTFYGIEIMFISLSSAIEKENGEKIDTRIVFELVKQVVDSNELIAKFNGQNNINFEIFNVFTALLNAIKKVGSKGLDPKNVFELIVNTLVRYNTLKGIDLSFMFKILLNVYATDQKQFGSMQAFVEQFGFKYVKNKEELELDGKRVNQLNNFLSSNSDQRKDLVKKFMGKAKINIDLKWVETGKGTDKKANEKDKGIENNSKVNIVELQKEENKKNENEKVKNKEIILEAKTGKETDKKVNEKDKETEDNSGVNIKEKSKKNENKKEGNEGVVFEAKTFLQQISNKPKAQESKNFSVEFKNVIANIGLWGQIKAFVWAILFKLGCMLRIFQPNDFSLKQTAQMKELEYVLRCGNLNDKQSAEGFIKRYNLVENNLEQPQTVTENELR